MYIKSLLTENDGQNKNCTLSNIDRKQNTEHQPFVVLIQELNDHFQRRDVVEVKSFTFVDVL